jgi:hypothetical protein
MPGIPELPRYGAWTMYAIMATVFGSLGQVLMTSGMKRGKAGTSALGNYTAVSRGFSFGGGVELVCTG